MSKITYSDYLPAGVTFDDLMDMSTSARAMTANERQQFLANNVNQKDISPQEARELLTKLGYNKPVQDIATTTRAFEALDEINEEMHRQTLVRDLFYSTVEEVNDNYEILRVLVKIDPGKIVDAYREAGFVTDDGKIIFPKGTQMTYVKTVQWMNKHLSKPRLETYDIYHVKGNKYCLAAINVEDVVEFFGA